MKERPILYCGAMVRAILADKKTQTRRVMNPQPHKDFLARGLVDAVPQWPHQDGVRFFMADGLSELVPCKYGKPGDRQWVRETFSFGRTTKQSITYTKFKRVRGGNAPVVYRAQGLINDAEFKWKPSIFMPRWAARITLEIVAIRVERLQDISEQDANAEGCSDREGSGPYISPFGGRRIINNYATLWNSINGRKHPWKSNPWVWVISFKRIS
jgi:hypothetical protein